MKIVNLKYNEFEQFVRNHPLRNYYQSVAYGTLMSNFGFLRGFLGAPSWSILYLLCERRGNTEIPQKYEITGRWTSGL